MCDTCFEGVTTGRIIMFLGSWPECRYSCWRRLPRAQKRLNVSSVIYTFSPGYRSRSNIQLEHHRCWNDRNTSRNLVQHYVVKSRLRNGQQRITWLAAVSTLEYSHIFWLYEEQNYCRNIKLPQNFIFIAGYSEKYSYTYEKFDNKLDSSRLYNKLLKG